MAGGIALGINAAHASASTQAMDSASRYYPDFVSEADLNEYAREVNDQIMEESVILLKNEDNALPFSHSDKVTLLGNTAYGKHPISAGTGSGAGDGIRVTLEGALRNVGLYLNRMAEDFYSGINPTVTLPIGMFGGNTTISAQEDPAILAPIEGSYRNFRNVIWTISRTGGEGADLPMFGLPESYAKDPNKHYLQLNDNEEKMLHYLEGLKEAGIIDKVVVLINSNNIIECGPLQDSKGVDSILWIGQPGPDGFQGVANVIVGKANPSGRTVDVWTRDHKLDPVWQNFGANTQHSTYRERNAPIPSSTKKASTSAISTLRPLTPTKWKASTMTTPSSIPSAMA